MSEFLISPSTQSHCRTRRFIHVKLKFFKVKKRFCWSSSGGRWSFRGSIFSFVVWWVCVWNHIKHVELFNFNIYKRTVHLYLLARTSIKGLHICWFPSDLVNKKSLVYNLNKGQEKHEKCISSPPRDCQSGAQKRLFILGDKQIIYDEAALQSITCGLNHQDKVVHAHTKSDNILQMLRYMG